jgi:hypothetical protein
MMLDINQNGMHRPRLRVGGSILILLAGCKPRTLVVDVIGRSRAVTTPFTALGFIDYRVPPR